MTGSGEIEPVTLEQLERLARSHPRSGAGGAGEGVGDPDAGTARSGWAPAGLPPCPPDWHPNPGPAWGGARPALPGSASEVRERRWCNLKRMAGREVPAGTNSKCRPRPRLEEAIRRTGMALSAPPPLRSRNNVTIGSSWGFWTRSPS
jgi:hypothetical protein